MINVQGHSQELQKGFPKVEGISSRDLREQPSDADDVCKLDTEMKFNIF